jgi:ferric-dicitrate binding protein FerR (iron transport regulator)
MSDNFKPPIDDRDDVAALVRLAGKRPAVPVERGERVRAAARAQWQREVRRRSRTRYLWTAAGLAAAASLVLVITLLNPLGGTGVPSGTEARGLVEAVTGPVWARETGAGEASQPRVLEVGGDILPGSELETAEEGRTAILLASGHSVRLDTSTQLLLLDSGSIALKRGAVYIASGVESTEVESLDVHTPLGVVHEVGTQFEVRLEGESVRVRLREGAVVVRHDDQADEVEIGSELSLEADGTVARREVSTHGPEWEWVAGITPMPDLEGLSARAFLDWVARERGWTLAFADETVARSAGAIVLRGTVERLTLEEALEAVLPTCRMTYRVRDGVLLIAAAPEEPKAA